MTPKSFTKYLISICLVAAFAGHAYAQNNLHDFSPSAGGNQQLFVAVGPGEAFVGTTATAIPRTVLTLSANTTNYVYVDLVGGTVTSNTSGFTSTSYPIAIAVTNNTSVSSLTDVRPGAFGSSTGGGGGGLSGMTAGQVPIAATASTVTSSEALAGSGAGITTGPASGVTTLDLTEFTGAAGQIADSGILAANVVTLAGSQTLTNKTLTAPSITGGALSGTLSGSPTFSGTPIFSSTLALNTTGTSGGLTGSPAITVTSCSGCGGGLSGLTTGLIPQAGSATTIINSSPQLDNGVTTANTMTYAGSGGIVASAGAVTAGNPSAGVGSNFFLTQEGTIPAGLSTAAEDNCYSDSTQHGILCNFNAGTTLPIVQGPASNTTGHLATWSGTNGGKLVDGGAVPTGTVTSVATTGPLGGGTITTTGTITCATCVTSAASLANGGVVLGTAGTQASATNTQFTFAAPTLTVGLAGTSSGILALTGSTSGSATFTAPAVAGTATNAIAVSNGMNVASGPAITAGTGGGIGFGCGTAPTGVASNDEFYCDSANQPHALSGTTNLGIVSTQSQTAQIITADWTCGTGGTNTSCVSAQTIGTLSFTLPLIAANWSFTCDLVVGQATAATANSWNVQTATNGATNLTASYTMATAATAMAVGAVTDVATSTTTQVIAPTWTLGGTATKMPVHLAGTIEGVSASGTVLNIQLVAPTVADLVTIYRGSQCRIF